MRTLTQEDIRSINEGYAWLQTFLGSPSNPSSLLERCLPPQYLHHPEVINVFLDSATHLLVVEKEGVMTYYYKHQINKCFMDHATEFTPCGVDFIRKLFAVNAPNDDALISTTQAPVVDAEDEEDDTTDHIEPVEIDQIVISIHQALEAMIDGIKQSMTDDNKPIVIAMGEIHYSLVSQYICMLFANNAAFINQQYLFLTEFTKEYLNTMQSNPTNRHTFGYSRAFTKMAERESLLRSIENHDVWKASYIINRGGLLKERLQAKFDDFTVKLDMFSDVGAYSNALKAFSNATMILEKLHAFDNDDMMNYRNHKMSKEIASIVTHHRPPLTIVLTGVLHSQAIVDLLPRSSISARSIDLSKNKSWLQNVSYGSTFIPDRVFEKLYTDKTLKALIISLTQTIKGIPHRQPEIQRYTKARLTIEEQAICNVTNNFASTLKWTLGGFENNFDTLCTLILLEYYRLRPDKKAADDNDYELRIPPALEQLLSAEETERYFGITLCLTPSEFRYTERMRSTLYEAGRSYETQNSSGHACAVHGGLVVEGGDRGDGSAEETRITPQPLADTAAALCHEAPASQNRSGFFCHETVNESKERLGPAENAEEALQSAEELKARIAATEKN